MGIMAAAAGRICCMDAGGILGDYVVMAITASGCAGGWLDVGMIAGDGVVAGRAAELGMGGMAKVFRIDIVFAADLGLVPVAGKAGNILAHAVAERVVASMGQTADGDTAHKEQQYDNGLFLSE